MKTIGLIGGMSWESTVLYYRHINQAVASHMGGLNSARILLSSLNFAEIAGMQRAGQWKEMASLLAEAAQKLVAAGADCILIGTNTMHKVAPAVQSAIQVPLLHIADATAQAIRQQKLQRVGLIGTRFTMEQPFYAEHLAQHGIETLIPDEADRVEVHRIIFDELCQGQILESSRQRLLQIAEKLTARGAQGLVLGCTEIPLLLQQAHSAIPLLDTTALHAQAGADFALNMQSA